MKITIELDGIGDIAALRNWLNNMSDQKSNSIVSLDLGAAAYNCLKHDGITTIDMLLEHSERMLLKMPNMGRKSLAEVVAALDAKGLKLMA